MKFLLIFASLLGLGAAQSLNCSVAEDNAVFCRMEYCQEYFVCVGGNEYRYSCLDDYHCNRADPSGNSCAPIDIAECDLSVPETPPLVDCSDFEENALVPHPESCYDYFQCMGGVPYQLACPRGMHFSPDRLECMNYNEANCSITESTSPSPTPPGPPGPPGPPSCDGVPNFRFVPSPESCENYYQCIDGNAFRLSCPRGLYFDEPGQTCSDPRDVVCNINVSPTPPTPPTAPTPPPAPSCDGVPNFRFIPHPNSCQDYFQCINGNAFLVSCPRGRYFSEPIQTCDYPQNVNCVTNPPNPPPTPPPQNVCVGAEDFVLVAHPVSCALYFQCISQREFIASCPVERYFDSILARCMDSSLVDCGGRNRRPEVTTFPPIIDTQCIGISNNTRVPNSNSCLSFFECIDGRAWPRYCDEGLWFDEERLECDTPANALCRAPTPPESESTLSPTVPTEFPSICLGLENGAYVASDTHCESYYMCFNNFPIPQTCEVGLWFDRELLSCRPIAEVNCTLSTMPPQTTTLPSTIPTVGTEDPLDICVGVEDGTLVGSNTFCERFYLCIDNWPTPDVCVDGYWFDRELQYCRPIDEVNCTLSTMAPTQPPTTTETTPFTLCQEARNGTYVANRMACGEFFVCLNDEPHPRRCQEGLWFSFIQQRCTDTYETQCDLYPIVCLGAEDDVPFRSPASCSDFVTCYDGIPYSSRCWHNMFFDEETGQCLPPDEVECDLNIPTEPPITPCDGARDFGLVASWDSCEEFFLCYAGEIWDTLQCPEGQIFNEARQVCGGEGEGEGFECWL